MSVDESFLVEKISSVKQIEIYLSSAELPSNLNDLPSSVCGHIYLKTDDHSLFQVDGDLLDVDTEEVASLTVSSGWNNLEISKTSNQTIMKHGEKIKSCNSIFNVTVDTLC